MKWLYRLIQWFSKKPVKLPKTQRTVVRSVANAQRVGYLQRIEIVLQKPSSQQWLQKAPKREIELIKQRVSQGTITEAELSNTISAWTIRNSPEVKEFNKLIASDPEFKQAWNSYDSKLKMSIYRSLSKRAIKPADAKNSVIKAAQAVKTDPLAAKMGFKVVQGIKFSADEISKINQFTDSLWKDMNVGYWKVDKKAYKITITGKPETWSDVYIKQFTKNKQQYIKYHIDPSLTSQGMVSKEVTVRIVSAHDAVKVYGKSPRTNGWANSSSNEVFLVYEKYIPNKYLKNNPRYQNNFSKVMYHELAHIKDPSITRSYKLDSTYKPGAPIPWEPDTEYAAQLLLSKSAPENWYKNYFFHWRERVANLAPVLSVMVSNTQKLVMKHGKKKTTEALNEISDWLSKGTPVSYEFKNPLSQEILGFSQWYDMPKILSDLPIMTQSVMLQNLAKKFFKNPSAQPINIFFSDYKHFYPDGYKQFSYKVANQVNALKQQVRQTRNLTPESIMEFKVIEE